MPIRIENPFEDPTQGLNPKHNPFVSQLIEGQEKGQLPVAFGPNLKRLPGNWRKKIATEPEHLILEIGCHNGDFINELARNNQNVGFIGADITFKRTVKTATKAKKQGNLNVLSVLANAKKLELLFKKSELDGLIIFFPDPWTKKRRQTHKRLVDEPFCQQVTKVLKDDGFLWIKTDSSEYFRDIARNLTKLGFHRMLERPLTCTDIKTPFERHFIEAKKPIFEGIWQKSLLKTKASPDSHFMV